MELSRQSRLLMHPRSRLCGWTPQTSQPRLCHKTHLQPGLQDPLKPHLQQHLRRGDMHVVVLVLFTGALACRSPVQRALDMEIETRSFDLARATRLPCHYHGMARFSQLTHTNPSSLLICYSTPPEPLSEHDFIKRLRAQMALMAVRRIARRQHSGIAWAGAAS